MAGDQDVVPVRPLVTSQRTKQLQEAFRLRFGREPVFYVRVPGRVNLIGEHIDYCGYGVCPMALEQDILLAISAQNGSSTLTLANLEKNYPDYECDLNDFTISVEGAPDWHQYFLCGVKGLLDVLPKETRIKGFDVAVSGIIPQSSGLSSSSALVSAAALGTAYVHRFSISKEKMANLCAECERYIGTQGGGMDQAIAFLATEGCAKLIEFGPLRAKDVVLPDGAAFVVAHSLTRMNKAATADFNCRVVECRLAAQILAKSEGLDWTTIRRLGDLQKALKPADLNAMLALVKRHLHEAPYTKTEILELLRTGPEKLLEISLTKNTAALETFKLRQRALHVFQEALRVEKFHEICSAEGGALEELGALMSESHRSLKELYECSHPQLDTLVEVAQGSSLGARLTGAGWGGCAVVLVRPADLESFVETLAKEFYEKFGVTDAADVFIFATKPQGGACIYE